MRFAPVIAVAAATIVFSVGQGLSYPLLAIILEGQGVSAGGIGFSAAATPVGILLSALAAPRILARFGAIPVALTCAFSVIALYALIALTRDPWLWLPLRFLLGVVLNPLFMLAELWTLNLAPPARRGRYMAGMAATMQLGFAAGPLILSITGPEGWTPFLVVIAAFMGCGAAIAISAHTLPDVTGEEPAQNPIKAIFLAPALMAAVAATSAYEHAALSLIPGYAGAHGYAPERASLILTAMIGGSILLTPLAGFAAERFGARRSMIAVCAATALGAPFMGLAIESWAIWPYAALWGGTYFGIYTLALVETGERFRGSALVALNAAAGLMWGMGGLIGAPMAGGAIDALGPEGLPAFFTLVFGALALFVWRRSRVRPKTFQAE